MLDSLDNPHHKFKSIHLAGTNGKGSVSHIMASAYQAGGYKVGIFTSPHIFDFRERVKINGQFISEEEVIQFLNKTHAIIDEIKASFFEITAALAFHVFANESVDIAIIETGLGGRLDSTNVLKPELSVITNIGLDHQAFLGDTIELIAAEKAGIIKSKTPVLVGKKQEKTEEVFKEIAQKNKSSLHYAEQADISTDLLGQFQNENASTALTAIKLLQETFPIDISVLHLGFNQVAETTNFKGRFQKISDQPLTIVDAAHNPDGVRNLMKEIEHLSFEKLHIVYGSSNDKEVSDVFLQMPKSAAYYLTTFDSKRSLTIIELNALATSNSLSADYYSGSELALKAAQKKAANEDLILVFGSFYIMADILADD